MGAAAALLRLLMIDRVPLSETEVTYALPAWQALRGQLDSSLAATGTPLLAHLLAGLFGLFGASDVAARLPAALAGVALALTPALLTAHVGLRAALWAAALLVVSPIAVQASRLADPSMLTAALVMLVVASAIRVFTDKPPWSPWALALGMGLSFAHQSSAVVALVAAAAAFAGAKRGGQETRPRGSRRRRGVWESVGSRSTTSDGGAPGRLPDLQPQHLLVAPAVAVLAATGALTDLRGLGFIAVDLWVGALAFWTGASFQLRNLAALTVYAGPLLALATAGCVLGVRERDPLRRFLGLWAGILMAMAAIFGPDGLSFVVLPLAPASLLAGTLLARLPLDPSAYRLTGPGWAALTLTGASGGIAALVFSQTSGVEGRGVAPQTLITLVAVPVLLLIFWQWRVPRAERAAAAAVLGFVAFSLVTAGSIGRSSFGGSPPGSELLPTEETDPAFRAVLRELNVWARADPQRVLVTELPMPALALWYGRDMAVALSGTRAMAGTVLMREAPSPSTGASGGPRIPWKTISGVETADLHPLGILRWVATRSGLVKGRPRDIILEYGER